MKKLLAGLLALLTATANAGDAVIWYGDYGKVLPEGGLVIGATEKIIGSFATDPSSGSGFAAAVGSIGMYGSGSVGSLYVKTGTADTAWTNVSGSGFSGTPDRAVVTNGSGALSTSSVTSTEVGYLSGVTSSLCGINQTCTETNKTFSLASNTFSGFTAGSVLFHNGTTIAQNNAKFFWDDANFRLGIGTSSPVVPFVVSNGGASGFEVIPSTNVTIQAYDRSGGAYTGLIQDALNFSFRPSGSTAAYIDSNGVGVGTTITTQGRLTSRGSGATNSTFSLITENSAGTDVLVVRDDGAVGIGANPPSSSYKFNIRGAGTTSSTYSMLVEDSTAADYFYLRDDGRMGLGAVPTSARAVIRGAGSTSSTSGFLVEDSAGTDIFSVRDDGVSAFGAAPQAGYRLVSKGASATSSDYSLLLEDSTGTDRVRARNDGLFEVIGRQTVATTDGTNYALELNHTGGTVGRNGLKINSAGTSTSTTALQIDTGGLSNTFVIYGSGNSSFGTTPVANNRLAVYGGGSTSSTFSLTARDSAGTNILDVRNDGRVGVKNSSPGSELDVKGTLRLSGSSSGYVGFAPAAAAGSTTYTLPSADGSSGQMWTTDGAGNISWSSGARVQIFGSRGTPRDIVAATGIVSGSSHMSTTALRQKIYVQGSGGAVTVTANPQVSAGTIDGQDMLICGRDSTNTVTLSNGTGLVLNGSAVLGQDDCITLSWDTAAWTEVSRNF